MDKSRSRLKVAIVGCGKVASIHMNAWKKVPFANVVAVCDVRKGVAQDFAKKWHIPHVYSKIEDLLDNEDISIVDICTPPMTHLDIGTRVIRTKHNVIFEKPFTLSLRDATFLLQEAESNKVKASVMYNILFEPLILKVRELIKKGIIGEIMHVNVNWLQTGNDPMTQNPNHWCHSIPGGRIGEMLPHPIYLTQAFLSYDLSVERVLTSKKGKNTLKYDNVQVIVRNDNDVFGTIYISFNSCRDAIDLTIFTRNAILKLDTITQKLIIEKELNSLIHGRLYKGKDLIYESYQLISSLINSALKIVTKRMKSGHDNFIYEYVKSILENKPLPVNLFDAVKTVQVWEEITDYLDK